MPDYWLDHIHLMSPDPVKTAEFYEKMFNAGRVSMRDEGDGRAMVKLDLHGTTILINQRIRDSTQAGLVHFGIGTDNLDEAIIITNGSRFGNAASIFTSNGKAAREFQYRIECGNVGINIGVVAPMAFFPFSGMKDSFFGVLHGQGKDAVRFFTESKVVIQRWL